MLSALNLGDIFTLLACLVVSMAAHEAMHAFMARALGDTTAEDAGRLTLNPLRHIDPITTLLLPVVSLLVFRVPFLAAKPVPFNPNRVRYGEMGAALVGIAGPCTNFVLAALSAVFIKVGGIANDVSLFNILTLFMEVNIALFVFNMIPFPPLDGSRLLYAFAPEPLQELMSRIEAAGFMAILIFIVLFFPFISPFIVNIDNGIFNFLLR
ncbi:MAG TPA: site-2 protease family protein [Candidatus Saccharimonadales bacterium]|nr:site-2 protease family protein [Candidatus Saccharimonadales bacterium]